VGDFHQALACAVSHTLRDYGIVTADSLYKAGLLIDELYEFL
jgi:hypothetical protein